MPPAFRSRRDDGPGGWVDDARAQAAAVQVGQDSGQGGDGLGGQAVQDDLAGRPAGGCGTADTVGADSVVVAGVDVLQYRAQTL